MIQETKNMWMCVGAKTKNINKGFFPAYFSVYYTRTGSIKKFIEDSPKSWRWWKRKGWKCVRVNISYKEIKP